MSKIQVFQIRPDLNNFRQLSYCELLAGNKVDLLAMSKLFYGPESVAKDWVAPKVRYVDDDLPKGDFPGFGAAVVFSDHAFASLRDLLEPNGECLPLESDVGGFTAFKVLRFVDALDIASSKIDWWPQLARNAGNPRVVRGFKSLSFREEVLVDSPIFKVPEMPMHEVFVTDVFVSRVQEFALKGFLFKQVWPAADDNEIRRKFQERQLRKTGR